MIETTRLSPEDIEAQLSEIAKGLSEADAARVRALIFLAGREQGNVALPEPMDDKAYVDRLGRLMHAAGRRLTQLAYIDAFGEKAPAITAIQPDTKLDESDLSEYWKLKVARIKSIKQLYHQFPTIKKGGTPNGYPLRGSLAVKQKWVTDTALKLALDIQKSNLEFKANKLRQQDQGQELQEYPVTDEKQASPSDDMGHGSGTGTPPGSVPT